MRLRRTFLWSMILSLSFAAALGIIAIIFDGLGNTAERVLATALLVGGFSLACMASAIVLDRRRLVVVMWIGIAGSLAALVGWLVVVWFDPWRWPDPWDELILRGSGTLTVVAVWAAHHGLLELPPLAVPLWRAVRRATLVLADVLAVSIVIGLWTDAWDWPRPWGEVYVKILAILSILAACGTVVTPILSLIGRVLDRDAPSVLGRRVVVSLTCPRCGSAQSIRVGGGRCAKCSLRITLEVDEPRCACGYLVHRLESDTCPECGRPVPEDRRWAGAPPAVADDPPAAASGEG